MGDDVRFARFGGVTAVLALLYTVGAVGAVLLPVLTVWIGVEVLRQPATWPARLATERRRTPLEREEGRAA